MNNISFLIKTEDNIIRVGIVLSMMLATIMPVEMRWSQSEVWLFYGIPAIFLWGFIMLVWNGQKFHCTLTDTIAVVWFIYYVGRTWMGNEWSCRMEFLKTTQLFLMYVSLRVALQETRIPAWVLIGCILAFGCYEAWLGIMQMYGDEVSRHNLFALTGNFLNPGPYSAYLMIGVVVGLVTLKDVPDKTIISVLPKFMPIKVAEYLKAITWKHLIIAAVTIMAMVLPATMSRAAFVSIAVTVSWIYRQYYWKYRYAVWGTIILAGCGFYFIKQGSADGRLIIWGAALTTWSDSPLSGVGIGGFRNAFAEGMSSLFGRNADLSSAGVTDNAYNILVKILVEQGIMGALIAVVLTLSVLRTLCSNSRPLFYGMLSLLLFSMFSYPFDLLPYKIIAVLIVAWSESTNGRRLCDLNRAWTSCLSCMLMFFSWQTYKMVKESYEADQDYALIRGFHQQAFIKDYYELLPLESDNPEFLFDFGKTLRDCGRYNDSNAMLRMGTSCSADPMFYVLMGNNYRDMQHYALAERAYEKAFAVMPNRLYPLYRLMLLYDSIGESGKAKVMARQIAGLKPKVESSATRDMKEKAKEIMSDKRGSRKPLTE